MLGAALLSAVFVVSKLYGIRSMRVVAANLVLWRVPTSSLSRLLVAKTYVPFRFDLFYLSVYSLVSRLVCSSPSVRVVLSSFVVFSPFLLHFCPSWAKGILFWEPGLSRGDVCKTKNLYSALRLVLRK